MPQWRAAPKIKPSKRQQSAVRQVKTAPLAPAPLLCAEGQVFLFFQYTSSRAASGDEARAVATVCVVQEAAKGARRVTSRPGEPEVFHEVEFDRASQAVFPWHKREKADVALTSARQAVHDSRVLANVGRHLSELDSATGSPLSEGSLSQLRLASAEARQAELVAERLHAVVETTTPAVEAPLGASSSGLRGREQPGDETDQHEQRDRAEDARRARVDAESQATSAYEGLELAVKAALGVAKAMLMDFDQVQSGLLRATATKLPEYGRLQLATSATASKSPRALGDLLDVLACARALAEAVRHLDLDALASSALRGKGGLGLRRYAAGQQVSVWQPASGRGGQWMDATVSLCAQSGGHAVAIEETNQSVTLRLTPWNHGPQLMRRGSFEDARLRYLEALCARQAHALERHAERHAELSGRGRGAAAPLDMAGGAAPDGLGLALELCVERSAAMEPPLDEKDSLRQVSSACGLSDWLHARHAAWCSDTGAPLDADQCILITSGAASGKTALMGSLAMLSARRTQRDGGPNLVPLIIRGSQLASWLLKEPEPFGRLWNFADAYCALEFGEGSATYLMLRQAMMARRALLLMDGIDEGGGPLAARIRKHVAHVLAPQGHLIVVTSRSAADAASHFGTFQHARILPCSAQVQQHALQARLGLDANVALEQMRRMYELVPAALMPLASRALASNAAYDARHSLFGSPLLLSVLLAALVRRRKPSRAAGAPRSGWPLSLAEVLEDASAAMLAASVDLQADVEVAWLAALLETAFLLAHVAHVAQIEAWQPADAADDDDGRAGEEAPRVMSVVRLSHLRDATRLLVAHTVAPPHALAEGTRALTRAIKAGHLPMLSLLQVHPLEFAASHVAFEAHYTARALSRPLGTSLGNGLGTSLSPSPGQAGAASGRGGCAAARLEPPWRWGARWAATLALGEASGVAFAEGLLRAAAVEQRSLHVEAQLGWLSDTNRPTAVRALALTMRAALVARLPKNQLRDADAAVLAATLRCADCTLLTLDLRGNAIGSSGGRSLGQALLANSTVTELRIDGDGTLPIDQLKGRTRVESLDLSVRGLGAASMAVVSALVARNRTLKDLSLLGNWSIGPEGGALMAECLETNCSLLTLDCYGCRLADEGVRALMHALVKANSTLLSLNVFENDVTPAVEQEVLEAMRQRAATLALRKPKSASRPTSARRSTGTRKKGNAFGDALVSYMYGPECKCTRAWCVMGSH